MVERKNKTLQDMVRVMIQVKNLNYYLWVVATNIACHFHNRVTSDLTLKSLTTSYGKK